MEVPTLSSPPPSSPTSVDDTALTSSVLPASTDSTLEYQNETSLQNTIIDFLKWVCTPFYKIYEVYDFLRELVRVAIILIKDMIYFREIVELKDFDENTFQKSEKINWEIVKKSAPPIDFDLKDQQVELDQLISEFDRLFPDRSANKKAREDLVEFLKYAKQDTYDKFVSVDDKLSPQQITLFFDTLRLAIKNLIVELQKEGENLTAEEKDKFDNKKRVALLSLSEAHNECGPRKLEGVMRELKRVMNREETVPDQLLRYMEAYKEEILIERCQRGIFHFINQIRKTAGDTLGLDCSELSVNDPFSLQKEKFTSPQEQNGIQPIQFFTLEQILHIFQKHFTEDNLCEALRYRIVDDGKNQKYLDFLSKPGLLTEEEIDKLADHRNPVYFNGKEITKEGVKLVLQKAGLWPFVNPS